MIFLLFVIPIIFFPPVSSAELINVDLGGKGHDLEYDAERGLIYISMPSLNEVVFLSTATYSIVDRVIFSAAPRGIELSYDGKTLFVTLDGEGAVALLDVETKSVEKIVIKNELDAQRTWDVLEAQPNRLFVTAHDPRSYVTQIRLDLQNQSSRVANGAKIYSGVLSGSPDQQFVYVGTKGISPASLYKLDLADPEAPIILEDNRELHGTHDLEVSPDGKKIFALSGQVLRPESFLLAGEIEGGLARFGDSPDKVFVAIPLQENLLRIMEFDSTSFIETNRWTLPCPGVIWPLADFFVAPQPKGFFVITETGLCGGNPPRIIVPPSSQTVEESQAATFQVEAAGDGQLTYQWFRNGSLIQGATSETFTLDTLREQDQGTTISVNVRDSVGSVMSKPALLTVKSSTPEKKFSVALGGAGHEMVYDAQRKQMYVTIPFLNEVAYVSTETFEVVERVVVGSIPRGIALGLNSKKLFVALHGAAAVAVVDIDAKTVETIVVGGEEMGASFPWDVLEVQPNRLFVTSNTGGSAHVIQVRLDQDNAISRVAGGRFITADPVLAKSPDQRFVYVGEGFSPNSLYKLDLSEASAPIILEDDHGSVSGTSALTVNPDGTRIHTKSGQILNTESFLQAGMVSKGFSQFDETGDQLFIATDPIFQNNQRTFPITRFDSNTFARLSVWNFPCPASNAGSISDFKVAPGQIGFLILTGNVICGGVPPSITTPPSSLTVDELESATFVVEAQGTGPLTYQWYMNGRPIPDATSSSFTVDSVQVEDNGAAITVEVRDGVGSVTSLPAYLYVKSLDAGSKVLLALGGKGHGMAFDPHRKQVYVTVPSLNEVVYVSTETFTVIDRVVVGSGPAGIDLSLDGNKLFVALNGAGAVAVVDIESKTIEEIVVGDELGSPHTWDVLEAQPNRLFVTGNPVGGFAYVIQVRLDQGNAISRVAGGRSTTGLLTKSPDQQFVYVGTWWKLDLSESAAPIILTNNSGSVAGFSSSAVSPDGTRIHSLGGIVFDTASFRQLGIVDLGVAKYGADTDQFFVASDPDTFNNQWVVGITAFDSHTFVKTDQWTLSAPDLPFEFTNDFLVLPQLGFLVLSGNFLLGGAPPRITTAPSSLTVDESESATFVVEAQGTGPLTYQWYMNGRPIPDATSSSFTVDSVQIENNGTTVTVVVSDEVGSATSLPALLTLNPSPANVGSRIPWEPKAMQWSLTAHARKCTLPCPR